jgi:hypothetical protein
MRFARVRGMSGEEIQEVRLNRESDEDQVSTAQRHVIEAEQHVADLSRILKEMVRDRHAEQAGLARKLLQTLEESLRLAREHLAREKKKLTAGTTN